MLTLCKKPGGWKSKGQLPEEKSRDLDHPPLLSHPTQGMAMQDREEASTLKLRSRVAGELALGPHSPYLSWGRSPAMARAPGPGEKCAVVSCSLSHTAHKARWREEKHPSALGCGTIRSYISMSLRDLRCWTWTQLEPLDGTGTAALSG